MFLQNYLQKILIKIVVALRNFCEFSLIHLTFRFLIRKKYSRGNSMPFMNKFIKKAYMKRTRLKNEYICEKKLILTELIISNNTTIFYTFHGKLTKIVTRI